ncbi:MAG: ABC transporter permease subunit [Bacteroidia bacterium]
MKQHYLKAELHKLLPYKTFWIILGLFLIIIPLAFYATSDFISGFSDEKIPLMDHDSIYYFPNVWHFATYLASFFVMLLSILLVIVTANEYSYGTFRQNMIDGLSRNQLFLAKAILALVLAVIATVSVFILGATFGTIYTPSSTDTFLGDKIIFIFYYFLHACGYLSFGLMLAVLIKKSGLAILLFLLYIIIIEPIGALIAPIEYRLYLPFQNMSALIPFPLELLLMQAGEDGMPIPEITGKEPFIAIGYILLFSGISWWRLKKKDL